MGFVSTSQHWILSQLQPRRCCLSLRWRRMSDCVTCVFMCYNASVELHRRSGNSLLCVWRQNDTLSNGGWLSTLPTLPMAISLSCIFVWIDSGMRTFWCFNLTIWSRWFYNKALCDISNTIAITGIVPPFSIHFTRSTSICRSFAVKDS